MPPLIMVENGAIENDESPDLYNYYKASEEELGVYDPDASTGNPLKGLYGSPYYHDYDYRKNAIPSSLEWYYFGLDDLMINDPEVVGNDEAFNWTKLDTALKESASRSMHAIFTVVCHYPGQSLKIPSYLFHYPSITLHSYNDVNGGGMSPDYGDPRLLKAMEQFISALGERYDGDTRIGSIVAGLLGYWGEWHTYPNIEWVPDHAMRNVTNWYQNAFSTTKIQVRYPYKPSLDARFGLSDGSFAYHTVDELLDDNIDKSWYLWNKVIENNATTTFWRKNFMGGETRPEIQSIVFQPDYPSGTLEHQDFMLCVNTTHASHMLHHDAFASQYSGMELQNAIFAHNRMGYNFIISRVAVSIPVFNNSILSREVVEVDVTIQQKGVAPFYYPLSLQLKCYNSNTQNISSWTLSGVESIIEQNQRKRFTFQSIPSSCLKNLTFSLHSPYAYPNRPIQFSQRSKYSSGTNALFSIVNIPLPSNHNFDEAIAFHNTSSPPSTSISATYKEQYMIPIPMWTVVIIFTIACSYTGIMCLLCSYNMVRHKKSNAYGSYNKNKKSTRGTIQFDEKSGQNLSSLSGSSNYINDNEDGDAMEGIYDEGDNDMFSSVSSLTGFEEISIASSS